ncbi:MAG: AbrB/MazE/SpoVT family DNA-binding domain-containing protein [Candidatus Woesearchaeota archaeon]|jgi:AbrB family looped-hinge helix DNA binding protein|nr:AbrB/MazE/SpoVT family DNA-binding domain-containing protein [Candidatus Woesearchaeota archaeon]|tara:strand:- start:514 stop:675 length:162 start_codon:yes stop_codon:yes gene_type:complete
MGNKVKVQKTKNNQHIITIPKTLAELFDIKQGSILEFKVNEKGEIVLRRKNEK